MGDAQEDLEGLVREIKSMRDIDELCPERGYDLIIECRWWPYSETDSQAMTDILKIGMKFSLQKPKPSANRFPY